MNVIWTIGAGGGVGLGLGLDDGASEGVEGVGDTAADPLAAGDPLPDGEPAAKLAGAVGVEPGPGAMTNAIVAPPSTARITARIAATMRQVWLVMVVRRPQRRGCGAFAPCGSPAPTRRRRRGQGRPALAAASQD